jgi:hypothetical protein
MYAYIHNIHSIYAYICVHSMYTYIVCMHTYLRDMNRRLLQFFNVLIGIRVCMHTCIISIHTYIHNIYACICIHTWIAAIHKDIVCVHVYIHTHACILTKNEQTPSPIFDRQICIHTYTLTIHKYIVCMHTYIMYILYAYSQKLKRRLLKFLTDRYAYIDTH